MHGASRGGDFFNRECGAFIHCGIQIGFCQLPYALHTRIIALDTCKIRRINNLFQLFHRRFSRGMIAHGADNGGVFDAVLRLNKHTAAHGMPQFSVILLDFT